MFKISLKPHAHKTEKYLENLQKQDYLSILNKYGQQGVEALSAATPKRTGKTAASWRYEIETSKEKTTILWINDNETARGDCIAIMIQHGHGTGTGGYVTGIDYINPAMKSVFDDITEGVWRVVCSYE